MAQSIAMSKSYTENSPIQLGAIGKCLEVAVFQTAVKRCLSNRQQDHADLEPFTIVDYGCANGSNSVKVLQTMISLIRSDHEETPVHICFADLPTNDWQQLYANVQQLEEYEGVTFQLIKGSFYDQLLLSDSVDIGFSCSSIHWLSESPCYQPALAFNWTVPEDCSFRASKWTAQSRLDLKRFYENRQRELKPGGELILLSCGVQPGVSNYQDVSVIQSWNNIVHNVLKEHELPCNTLDFVAPLVLRTREDLEAGIPCNMTLLEYFHLKERLDFDLGSLDDAEKQKNYLDHVEGMFKTFLEPLYRSALSSKCGVTNATLQDHYIKLIFLDLRRAFLPLNWRELRSKGLLWNSILYHVLTLKKQDHFSYFEPSRQQFRI